MSELRAGLLLFAACFAYNLLLSRCVKRDAQHGMTALWVVGGVLLVLIVAATIPDTQVARQAICFNGTEIILSNAQHAAWLMFKLFCFAGFPMVLGSFYRHWTRIMGATS